MRRAPETECHDTRNWVSLRHSLKALTVINRDGTRVVVETSRISMRLKATSRNLWRSTMAERRAGSAWRGRTIHITFWGKNANAKNRPSQSHPGTFNSRHFSKSLIRLNELTEWVKRWVRFNLSFRWATNTKMCISHRHRNNGACHARAYAMCKKNANDVQIMAKGSHVTNLMTFFKAGVLAAIIRKLSPNNRAGDIIKMLTLLFEAKPTIYKLREIYYENKIKGHWSDDHIDRMKYTAFSLLEKCSVFLCVGELFLSRFIISLDIASDRLENGWNVCSSYISPGKKLPVWTTRSFCRSHQANRHHWTLDVFLSSLNTLTMQSIAAAEIVSK